MDIVTHAMTGALVGAIAATKRPQLYPALLTGALASALPDLDAVLHLIDYDLFVRYHRLFTHNLFALPLIAALAAAPASAWVRGRFLYFYLIALVSAALHLGMDLICHCRLLLLYPLSRRPFQLSIIGFSSNWALLSITAAVILVIYLRRRQWSAEVS